MEAGQHPDGVAHAARLIADLARHQQAADRSPRRRLDDPDLIARMRAMTVGERLEAGFEQSGFASELAGAARR